MDRYYPQGDKASNHVIYGYLIAQTMVEVLKRCGDDLTRENIMKQAAGIKKLELGMLLPGITINTSSSDFAPLKQLQMQRFKGERFELFGPVITNEAER